jgi:predicted O-methyltransferase YrrM
MLNLPIKPQSLLNVKDINWCGLPRRFMNPGELETLVALARSVDAETVVEIGVNEGRTARLMVENVATIKQYVGVDVLPGYVPACKVQSREVPTNPGHYAAGSPAFHLILRERGSLDLSPQDLPKCDFMFIDGDHGKVAVAYDTSLARHVVRPGGLIVWHDYHNLGTVDVRDVLHEFQSEGHRILNVERTWIAYEIAA